MVVVLVRGICNIVNRDSLEVFYVLDFQILVIEFARCVDQGTRSENIHLDFQALGVIFASKNFFPNPTTLALIFTTMNCLLGNLCCYLFAILFIGVR